MPVVAPVIAGIPQELQGTAPVLSDPPTDHELLAATHWAKQVRSEMSLNTIGHITDEKAATHKALLDFEEKVYLASKGPEFADAPPALRALMDMVQQLQQTVGQLQQTVGQLRADIATDIATEGRALRQEMRQLHDDGRAASARIVQRSSRARANRETYSGTADASFLPVYNLRGDPLPDTPQVSHRDHFSLAHLGRAGLEAWKLYYGVNTIADLIQEQYHKD